MKLIRTNPPALSAAVMVIGYFPAVPGRGVPNKPPVELKNTPLGKIPERANVGAVRPTVVNQKALSAPIANVASVGLVIAGPFLTVKTKVCVATLPTPLFAVIVSG